MSGKAKATAEAEAARQAFNDKVDQLMLKVREEARGIFGPELPPLALLVANGPVKVGTDVATRWNGESPAAALSMLEAVAGELREAGADRARLFRDIH